MTLLTKEKKSRMNEFRRLLKESLVQVIAGLALAGILAVVGALYAGWGIASTVVIVIVFVAITVLTVFLISRREPPELLSLPSEVRNLEERQQAFEDYEAVYLKDPRLVRSLAIRKETVSSFLAIPDDGTNVFRDHDMSERRMEATLRRKGVYRKFIEQGAKVKLIISVNQSGITQRGYGREAAISRLRALRAFIADYIRSDNFFVVRRSPGAEYRHCQIYNTDVMIDSMPLRPPHQRVERARVVLDNRIISREIKAFDERFDLYTELNLKDAVEAGITAEGKCKARIIKEYLVHQIDLELESFGSNNKKDETNSS
jgi:hypothetical protein